jgi:hypothetical protein
MNLYNLNFYENNELIIACFMQTEANTAKDAMRTFKVRLNTRGDYIDALSEIKESYPNFKMKAEVSPFN